MFNIQVFEDFFFILLIPLGSENILGKHYVLCCYQVECSINVSFMQLFDGVVHFHIFAYLLSTSSIDG